MLPALGGSVASLRYGGHDILRPTPEGATDPLQTACFPLVPFANRIAHGAFEWKGHSYRLLRNFGDHPHVLHGTGWQSPWTLVGRTENMLSLEHRHEGDAAWPWSFVAWQDFCLSDDGIEITITLTNLADEDMPAGLGFHPYFNRDADTLLQVRLGRPWMISDDCLPVTLGAVGELGDWSQPAPPQSATLIDHCFEIDEAALRISQVGAPTIIATAGPAIHWLHLYMPPGEPYFCAEPVSHMPDAINRMSVAGNGMRILPPSEAMACNMTIGIEAG